MTIQLNEEQKTSILAELYCNFADLCLSEKEVTRLQSAVNDIEAGSITKYNTKKLLDRYFPDRNYFRDHPDKNRRRDLTVLFKSCYVLICYYQQRYSHLKYDTIEELKQNYPQFAQRNLFEDELNLLLRFRNLMRIALEVIDAYGNKHVLLKIAGRLEGSHREYITGGGQTLAVKCRVEIYEQEGAVRPRKRPERKASPPPSTIWTNENETTHCDKRKMLQEVDEQQSMKRIRQQTDHVHSTKENLYDQQILSKDSFKRAANVKENSSSESGIMDSGHENKLKNKIYDTLAAPIGLPRWRLNQQSQHQSSSVEEKLGSISDSVRLNSGFHQPTNHAKLLSRDEKIQLLQKRLMELPLEAFSDAKVQHIYRLVMHKQRMKQLQQLPY